MSTISDDYKAVFMGTIYQYKDVSIPVVNEEKEERNISDPYTAAFIKSGVIVGHMPCWIFNKTSHAINRIKVNGF